jgi:predicted phage terminase large subunit-like protein
MQENNLQLLAKNASVLLNDYLAFTRFFYKKYTRNEFHISQPISRRSHHYEIADALIKVYKGEIKNLLIVVPPRHSKTEMIKMFIAWAWARNPKSNWLYVSADEMLATKATASTRQIMQCADYSNLFGVRIARDSDAKGAFATNFGGTILARGVGTQIEGHGAGIKYGTEFSGAIIEDDLHKRMEVWGEARETVKGVHKGTIIHRRNDGANTPIIHICQALHQDDLRANLIKGFDGLEWTVLHLSGRDKSGNILDPRMYTTEYLDFLEKHSPYEYWSQIQGEPQPLGGGIFRRDNFRLVDFEPEILKTFITIDTAETEKTCNDPTVFSFWGVYRTQNQMISIHWIDCVQIWVEPKDLETNFWQFFAACCMHKVPPEELHIETKSTGVTLYSVIKNTPGLKVRAIDRTKASGSKIVRYLEMQPYVSQCLISLPKYGSHTQMVINHMADITNNGTHQHDDICDTAYDAVNSVFIQKTIRLEDNTVNDIDAVLNKNRNVNSQIRSRLDSDYGRLKI